MILIVTAIIVTRVSKTSSASYIQKYLFLFLCSRLSDFFTFRSRHVNLRDYSRSRGRSFRFGLLQALRGRIAAQKQSPRFQLRHGLLVSSSRSAGGLFAALVPFARTSVWTSSPSSRKFSGRFRACETFAAPFAACCGRYRVLAASSP